MEMPFEREKRLKEQREKMAEKRRLESAEERELRYVCGSEAFYGGNLQIMDKLGTHFV